MLPEILDLGHHLVDGPDHPEVRLRHPRRRRGRRVGEASQLGQHANAESGGPVLVHLQVFQPGAAREGRNAETLVQHHLAVLGVYHARQVVSRPFAYLDAFADLREGLACVAGHAYVGLQKLVALFGQQAEGRPANDDLGLAVLTDAVDHVPRDGECPLRVQVAVIAQVAQRYAYHVRPEILDDVLDLGQVVVGEHQVDDLDLVPLVVQVSRYVGQSDGHGLGIHSAVQPVLPVGGDEQDSHENLQCSPPCVRPGGRAGLIDSLWITQTGLTKPKRPHPFLGPCSGKGSNSGQPNSGLMTR